MPTPRPYDMKMITICVDFADLLALTLRYNRHHFSEVMVVTTPADKGTQAVAEDNAALVCATNTFYDDGALFNKWKALEIGLDKLGRDGWLCILDADVVVPKYMTRLRNLGSTSRNMEYKPGHLYTPKRRMLHDLSQLAVAGIPNEESWDRLPYHPQQTEWAGYCQIFHATDPVLGPAPWHQIDWRHAGGADSFFQAKWPGVRKLRPVWDCLHLGNSGENWLGRVTPYLDGTTPPEAERRRAQLRNLIHSRRSGPDRFKQERL